MIANVCGRKSSFAKLYRAGNSLRFVRSPVAPKMTITHGSAVFLDSLIWLKPQISTDKHRFLRKDIKGLIRVYLLSNSQLFPKIKLAGIHLTVIRFMIVTAQMEHAVKDELPDLALERQAVFESLLLRLLGRDHYVA